MSVITGDSFDQDLPALLNQVTVFTSTKRLRGALFCIAGKSNRTMHGGPVEVGGALCESQSKSSFPPSPDGSDASKEVFGGVLPVSQSHSHKRSRQANDLQEAICHQPAPEEAS